MGYLVLTRCAGQTIKIGSRVVLKVEDIGIKNVKVSFEVTSSDRRVKSFCLIHVGESVWEPLSPFYVAEIKVARIDKQKVRIAINAPEDVLILRGEVMDRNLNQGLNAINDGLTKKYVKPADPLRHGYKIITLPPQGKES